MQYFKASQPIPGKGDALVYYECEKDQSIVRQLTYLPATNEIETVADPIVKKLYRPELLLEASKEEFDQYWLQGQGNQ